MKIKSIVRDNRGVTLAELLVAIVILGIVTSPLLHSFVTASRTTRKSGQYGDATIAAQNLIETIESTDVDSILTNAESIGSGAKYYTRMESEGVVSYTECPSAVKDEDGKYYIGLPVSSGNSSFDALVTLDASHLLNSEPVTEYTDLIATLQPSGADNPDALATSRFEEACAAKSGVFDRFLERAITLTVGAGTPEAGGETKKYPVGILYEYSGHFRYYETDPLTGDPVGPYYQSFSDSYTSGTYYTGPASGLEPDEPVFSMYYFFDTFYGYGSNTDTIKIYNRDNNSGPGSRDLCFNLFLVRQKNADTPSREASYSAYIEQHEPYGLGIDEEGNYRSACKVYTNMNTNLNTGEDISSFDYRVYRSALWFNPGTSEPKLVVSGIIDRLLYVDVQLYPSGSGYTGTAIASMKTTKLD